MCSCHRGIQKTTREPRSPRHSRGAEALRQLGHAACRRQLEDAPALRARGLGHLDRPLRRERRDHGKRASPRPTPRARSWSRTRRTTAGTSSGASTPRGSRSGGASSAVRTRSGGAADGADPRSHQRRRDGQPAREPADRVPQLRGDAGHALRPQPAATSTSRSSAGDAGSVSCRRPPEQRYCSRACGTRYARVRRRSP